jgi:hypothetical protein
MVLLAKLLLTDLLLVGLFLLLLLLLVWLLLLPLLLGNSTHVVCQSMLNHQNGGEFTYSCISIAALGLISAAFPARLTPHPITVDLSENYFMWPGHTGDDGLKKKKIIP